MPEPSALTDAQLRALAWIARNGGHARIDRYGRLVSNGGARSSHQAATFLRLITSGHLSRSPMPGHIGITQLGLGTIEK
jgi:hypothetical protein